MIKFSAGFQEVEERQDGKLLFNECTISVWGAGKVLEMDGDGGDWA